MFTGIIIATGQVQENESGKLKISVGKIASQLKMGESVAINGVCLTVSEIALDEGHILFNVSEETLSRTTLGKMKRGGSVNIELSLGVGDRLGGHWVQGHIDAVGEVVRIDELDTSYTYTFQVDPQFDALIVDKGSIAIDGISLTPFNVNNGRFDTAIIPHTLNETTLKLLTPGDKVNIEFDIVGKYIRKQLRKET